MAYVFRKSGTPAILRFVGDSIEYGLNTTSGYGFRKPLYDYRIANAFLFTTIGTVTAPVPPGDTNNKSDGNSGARINTIKVLNDNNLATLGHCDLASLMIGTNDVTQLGYTGPTEISQYVTLIQQMSDWDPNASFAVSTIPPIGSGNSNANANANAADFNSRLVAVWDAEDTRRAGWGGSPLIRCDAWGALGGAWSSTYYGSDDLHINTAGWAAVAAERFAKYSAAGIVEPANLNPKTAVSIRNAALDAFDVLSNGKLRIYDSTQPADADAALGGQALLADLALAATAFAAASSGSKAANSITQDSSADATGIPSWGSLLTSANVRKLDFSVGVSGANLNFDSAAIASGAVVAVSSFSITQAA